MHDFSWVALLTIGVSVQASKQRMPVSNPASTSYIQGLFHNQQAKKDAARHQQAQEAAAGASCNNLTEALNCLSVCCELAAYLVVATVSGWGAQPLSSAD